MRSKPRTTSFSSSYNGWHPNASRVAASTAMRVFKPNPLAAVIAATFVAGGCTTLGPDFKTPDAPVAEKFAETQDPKAKSEQADYRSWWTTFNDPILNSLVETAYAQNYDLQSAGMRILQARANLGIATGSQYPQTQQGIGGLTYNEISENSPNFRPSIEDTYWEANLGFDAAWELDFWGRFRRAVESADATLIASVANYDDVLVILTAEVARIYMNIRTVQELIRVQRRNVEVQARSLQIAEVRFENGAVTELDVQQAVTLLRDTEANIPDLQRQLSQSEHALSVLLGQPPGGLSQTLGIKPIPSAPPTVAVGIPADLLRRRPDVRRVQLQAAAASAEIGVARTDMFPRLSLFGTIGLQSSDTGNQDLGDLFNGDSFTFTGGPQFSWAILNYGRLKNNVRLQDAQLQQLLVDYQNTVLQAAQEVEDGLVGFLQAQNQTEFLKGSVKAAQRSVDLALIQYRDGAVDFQRVLDTQRALLAAQNRLATSQGAIATNLVATYKALGGGWEQRVGNPFVSDRYLEEMRNRTDWGDLLEPEQAPETLDPPPPARELPLFPKPDW